MASGRAYEVEVFDDLDAYYSAYPAYCNKADIEAYPQLDPRISLGQLSFYNSVRADLEILAS
jgi:hypothetical protein